MSTGRWLSAMGVHPTLRIDGMQDPESIVEQLEAFRPDLITALPGMLVRVADYLDAIRIYMLAMLEIAEAN